MDEEGELDGILKRVEEAIGLCKKARRKEVMKRKLCN